MVFLSILAFTVVFVCAFNTSGQTFSITFDLPDLCRKNQFETFNRKISWFNENDKKGIRLTPDKGEGIAWLRGFEFVEGVIEADIRIAGTLSSGSSGIAFHVINEDTLDIIYINPFILSSVEQKGKSGSVTYISYPEDNIPHSGENKQELHESMEDQFSEYHNWVHLRIEVELPYIEVFINDFRESLLKIEKHNDRKAGMIGFVAGNNSGVDFANLRISTGGKRDHGKRNARNKN